MLKLFIFQYLSLSYILGHMIHHVSMGSKIKQCVHQIPMLTIDASIQPITRTVLRVRLSILPDFRYKR